MKINQNYCRDTTGLQPVSIYIQPTVSFKINDKLSFGGGPIYVTGSVNFNRNLNRTLTDLDGNRSNVTIDASGVSNWGWVAWVNSNQDTGQNPEHDYGSFLNSKEKSQNPSNRNGERNG